MLLRRLALSGDYNDTDWTDPANSPPTPGVAKATATEMTFAIIGKASAAGDAAIADVGTLMVDAFLAIELPSGAIVRGSSIVEVKGEPSSGRVMLVADRPPSGIDRIDDRLRSRFEGGLVLEVEGGAGAGGLELVTPPEAQARTGPFARLQPPATPPGAKQAPGAWPRPGASRPAPQAHAPARGAEPPRRGGTWFPTAESVVIHWPKIEELLQEELD